MANIVKENGNKILICDSTGKTLVTFKNVHSHHCTHNFLEILTYKGYAKDTLNTPNADILRKKIININTLQVLYNKPVSKTPLHYLRTTYIANYVYLHPLSNNVYDENNNLLLESVSCISYLNLFTNVLIIKHLDDKYSFIYKNNVLIKNADFISLLEEKLLVINNGLANTYTNYTTSDINSMICISNVTLPKAITYNISLLSAPKNVKAIYIEYFESDTTENPKSEIRALDDLNKVIKLSESERLVNNSYSRYGYFVVKQFDNSVEIGFKFIDLANLKYLTEDVISGWRHFIDCNNKEYLVLGFPDSIIVYSLPECKLIISGNYTNVSLSSKGNYFILEKNNLKGLATLNVEILLKCNLYCLEETADSFLYSDIPLKELKK